MSDTEYRNLLLSLIASLTLSDHMGDVSNDVHTCLRRIPDIPNDVLSCDWEELGPRLGRMGIKTLYGTELTGE